MNTFKIKIVILTILKDSDVRGDEVIKVLEEIIKILRK